MKNLGTLFLYFCLSFAAIFAAAAAVRFLAAWVEMARFLPQYPLAMSDALGASALWALPAALCGSLLLSLNYTARKMIALPLAVFCLILTALAFSFAVSLALNRLAGAGGREVSAPYIGGGGLILGSRQNIHETAIVLLRGAQASRGPRVVAIPGQPLAFHEEAPPLEIIHLPPLPFPDESPAFLQSVAIDLHLSALNMERLVQGGSVQFLVGTGAFVFFVSSLGVLFYFSAWPLAGFLIGCLAFRGVLALENFLNTPAIFNMYWGLLANWLPQAAHPFALPAVLIVLGAVTHVISALAFISKRRKHG